MKSDSQHTDFILLKRKFQLLRFAETGLWALAGGLVSYYLLQLFPLSTAVPLTAALVVTLVIAAWRFHKLRVFKVTERDLATYINRQYPALEESADLLLQHDETLSDLQRLQKSKTRERFQIIITTVRIPHKIGQAAAVFFLSFILSSALTAFKKEGRQMLGPSMSTGKMDSVSKKHLPAILKRAVITISPPTYTGKTKYTSGDLNLVLPENSMVHWNVVFQGDAIDPRLIFSAKDTTTLRRNASGDFQTTRSFNDTGFYQIAWKTSDNSTRYSDFYKIEIISDRPPTITVENLNQFVELKSTDTLKVKLTSNIIDDYGIRSAYIVATVSKGSGEAIKFREEKLAFDRPEKISGKKVKASTIFDLLKLGLQPGDELYFYIEALDVRHPMANRSRTETYFISLQDTSSQTITVDAALGVDLMPEYFRSQRQIIIDSEKLLREKKAITKNLFNDRSNELGYDQKVLRLRYGEFLGEEFESGITSPHDIPSASSEDSEDVVEKFGHSHDTENEHNLVEEKKDPLKALVHAHDGDEEATFFVQSIKAKLKAAVTIMWDAELYLRLYQPEKSLPFQYKALKLLKEISQDSRIYVHRTGFDPPPLKEEKRLSGDLAEINATSSTTRNNKTVPYPAIRNALSTIEALLESDSIILTAEAHITLTKAGRELAGVAVDQPGRYLQSLSLLRSLLQDELHVAQKRKALSGIRSSFWNVIPSESMSPQRRSIMTHQLDSLFLEMAETSKINN